MNSNITRVYLASEKDSEIVTDDRNILDRFLEHNKASTLVSFSASPEQADIILVFEKWSFKLPAYGKQLAADPFFKTFAEKIFVVNYDSTVGEGFLPGCYVSLNRHIYDSDRFRPCAYPKVYNEYLSYDHENSPLVEYLFSFRGTLHSHPVRPLMFHTLKDVDGAQLIDNSKEFHSHNADEKRLFVTEIMKSHFVLCPRGSSPNSYRLFESMSLATCPVIISDDWLEPDGPDWPNCSIRIAEADIKYTADILNERVNEAAQLGQNAYREWLTHFTVEAKNKAFLKQILELYNQSVSATKSLSEYQKHWNSHRFLHNNDWSLSQKLGRKLKALVP